jgi:hypothetical protein
MKAMGNEGVRRLSALAAVLAAVAAQSFVTGNVDAEHELSPGTFGVQLLERELAAPVSLAQHPPPVLLPSVAEPQSSAATLLRARLVEPTMKGTAPRRATNGFRVLSERRPGEVTADWPENRDASGALIQLTENDVLIPF